MYKLFFSVAIMALLVPFQAQTTGSSNQITILYDAFGQSNGMQQDWGFSAFIEFNGKKILFDTGNNAAIFKHNVEIANINLSELDYVIISHRHGDHTTGLNHLFKINPSLPVHVPQENFGVFGGHLSGTFYPQVAELPKHMRTFNGDTHDRIASGSPWENVEFIPINKVTEIFKDIFILPTTSESSGTRDLEEISLALKTNKGLVLVAGCSHPGIENIVDLATSIDDRIFNIFGGFHLLRKNDAQLSEIAKSLKRIYGVNNIAPGHCTGEPAFSLFSKIFGNNYTYAGLGSVIALPQ